MAYEVVVAIYDTDNPDEPIEETTVLEAESLADAHLTYQDLVDGVESDDSGDEEAEEDEEEPA